MSSQVYGKWESQRILASFNCLIFMVGARGFEKLYYSWVCMARIRFCERKRFVTPNLLRKKKLCSFISKLQI